MLPIPGLSGVQEKQSIMGGGGNHSAEVLPWTGSWTWSQLQEFWQPLFSGSSILLILQRPVLASSPVHLLLFPPPSLSTLHLSLVTVSAESKLCLTWGPLGWLSFSILATLIVSGFSYPSPVLVPGKQESWWLLLDHFCEASACHPSSPWPMAASGTPDWAGTTGRQVPHASNLCKVPPRWQQGIYLKWLWRVEQRGGGEEDQCYL